MKKDLFMFVFGIAVGICVVMCAISSTSEERYAIIIKAHQDGRIACNNVGDEFICREVQK